MTNLYFSASSYTPVARLTTARAEAVDAILAAIVTGFDLLPTPTDLLKQAITFVASDTGVAGAYVITQTYLPLTYSDGMEIVFRSANTNVAASTVNVNAIGVIGLRNAFGVALSGGECASGVIVMARYDATNGYFRIVNPLVAVGSVTVNNLVKNSATDTTPGYLATKLTFSGSLVATTSGGGANESRDVTFTFDEGQGALYAGVMGL